MARNRPESSQRFMQLRVGAQAFTLVAVMFALYNATGRVTQPGTAAAEQQQALEPATAPVMPSPAAAGGGMRQS